MTIHQLIMPEIGASVPRSGNRFSRWLGRRIMSGGGWHFAGRVPDIAKCVMIVAHHTSNWDFPAGVGAKWALGLRAHFLGKASLFRFPLGIFMSWLGGIPVDRSRGAPVVTAAVEKMRELSAMWLVIAPEGTRSAVTRWKTGFHRIAREARVPILPVAMDWHSREIRLFDLFDPGPDLEADMARIRAIYDGIVPRRAAGVDA
ncbi:MAG: lysophospholipid acyltransferase family protein [Chromatiales bacterium]